MRTVLGTVTEFPHGKMRILRVGGREIGVFRFGDAFYAVRNRCPHQGAPLCLGYILPRIASSGPGDVDVLDAPPLVACPWHGWQYDARTGEAYAPGDPRVKSYGVSIERGEALAEQAADPSTPFAAETYDVFVDDDYLILDA